MNRLLEPAQHLFCTYRSTHTATNTTDNATDEIPLRIELELFFIIDKFDGSKDFSLSIFTRLRTLVSI